MINSMDIDARLCNCSNWKSMIPFRVYLLPDSQAFVDILQANCYDGIIEWPLVWWSRGNVHESLRIRQTIDSERYRTFPILTNFNVIRKKVSKGTWGNQTSFGFISVKRNVELWKFVTFLSRLFCHLLQKRRFALRVFSRARPTSSRFAHATRLASESLSSTPISQELSVSNNNNKESIYKVLCIRVIKPAQRRYIKVNVILELLD